VTSHFSWTELLIFALLGLAAVLAAMLYTLGPRPYGYRGWGDLYCFLFFGIASVFGTYYLATQSLDWNILLPASSLGLLSNAVLNINNMRDCENDRINSKNTLVVKIGLKKAYIYHSFLLFTPFLLFTLYNVFTGQKSSAYFFWMMFPLFAADWLHIVKTKELSELDPFLKKQVIKTFLLVLFYGLLLQL
jgi:1,4-dihydroxy-2-naphthoate octaprenyltransferase